MEGATEMVGGVRMIKIEGERKRGVLSSSSDEGGREGYFLVMPFASVQPPR